MIRDKEEFFQVNAILGTIRRGVDSAAEPPDSERSPAERRQNIFRMDSKLFWRTPADSGGLRADSSGLQADFKVRRGLRAAPRRTGGVSAAD